MPAHDKTYKLASAPIEDSDQPGHPSNMPAQDKTNKLASAPIEGSDQPGNPSNMSQRMTKPTNWQVRPVKTQISLGIRVI